MDTSELSQILQGVKILGVKDTDTGIALKKKYKIKRFKKVDLLHTDREVKEKGVELISLSMGADKIGLVQGYQNIKLYEIIDFDKPARSMQT